MRQGVVDFLRLARKISRFSLKVVHFTMSNYTRFHKRIVYYNTCYYAKILSDFLLQSLQFNPLKYDQYYFHSKIQLTCLRNSLVLRKQPIHNMFLFTIYVKIQSLTH